MGDRHLLLVGVVLVGIAACAEHRVALPEGGPGLDADLRVRAGTAVRTVPLEEYVTAVVLGELAPGSEDTRVIEDMLEVQAITSRTYAVGQRGRHAAEGFDLCSSTHCQVYDAARIGASRWSHAVAEVVARTKGIVLQDGGQLAEVVFHADCGGHTAAAVDVWGGPGRRYLVAAPDVPTSHLAWEFSVNADDLRELLPESQRTALGRRLVTLDVVERDRSGRAARIALRGDQVIVLTGEELRRAVSRGFGPASLRSTLFDVRATGRTFTFTGRGYGHGVGLCQAGALARLRTGSSPFDVLRHYFPGTRPGHL